MAHSSRKTLFYCAEFYKVISSSERQYDGFLIIVPDHLPVIKEIYDRDYFDNAMTYGRTKEEAMEDLQRLITMVTGKGIEDQCLINIRDHSDIYLCNICYPPFPKFDLREAAVEHLQENHV